MLFFFYLLKQLLQFLNKKSDYSSYMENGQRHLWKGRNWYQLFLSGTGSFGHMAFKKSLSIKLWLSCLGSDMPLL